MNKVILAILACAVLLVGRLQASEPATSEAQKIYGKVVSIDSANKNLKIFNKKRNQETLLRWNDETSFVSNKKAIQPSDLGEGQFLMVSYIKDDNSNLAKKVMLRPAPFQKKMTKQ